MSPEHRLVEALSPPGGPIYGAKDALTGEQQVVFRLRSELDLQLALSHLPRTVLLAGVAEAQRTLLCTIAAELGSNMLKFAHGGDLRVCRCQKSGQDMIEILSEDTGPGIADVPAAVCEHFSTAGTLGLGLPGVIRMADQVHIETGPGCGTSVRALTCLGEGPPQKRAHLTYLLRPGAKPTALQMSCGRETRPCLGQPISGDAIVFRQITSGQLLVAMIDASGHGPRANDLVMRLVALVEGHPRPDIVPLLEALHQACRNTAGAAAGVARIDPVAHLLRYAGVGNVRAHLLGPGSGERAWAGVSRNGVLGDRFPTPFVQQVRLSPGQVLLLCSDGVSESLGGFRGGLPGTSDAPALAHQVVSQCGQALDDAACAVVRLA
ncbi:SpoIIE family protein phosphatase [Roseateles saccharophilus]|uniref:Anti-sigma regulatory factor (Ser/Thr protein kinase) n=1 Tax=Roseateles saccharophilus TaxID=304 RepID=A0A4R3UNI7_ROSSA|nr:SpoIIE family protein phosphatase [Roseateles saccharophilus]MDG0833478.1 histidine kinase [Roseateles saccharophilus]TCU92502.1 anti-sigma regulatory factor (Ser/Thr protein kinase) [Roseateles saccharophilus]